MSDSLSADYADLQSCSMKVISQTQDEADKVIFRCSAHTAHPKKSLICFILRLQGMQANYAYLLNSKYSYIANIK